MTAAVADDWITELTAEQLNTDPYPVFARLRREAPLVQIPAIHGWMASTWDVCTAIAEDEVNFVGGHNPLMERVIGSWHVARAEGDLHQRLRGAMAPNLHIRGFRAQIESRMRPVARACAESLRGRDRIELMAEYFEPVSVRCVGDTLGFEDIDTDTLRRWFHGLASGMANIDLDPRGFAAADAAAAEIREVVGETARRVTAEPDDGVVSHWLHDDMPEGEVRSLDDLWPTLSILLLGGLQEPGHACGTTFLGLAGNPDQLARVVADPTLVPRAIAEGLRWIAPVFGGSIRVAAHDVVVAGQQVRAGDNMWLGYGSANRDEAKFERPDQFDVDRPGRGHLAFGMGRHGCAGSALGPQIARVALEELFAAYPGIRLDPDVEPVVWGWLFRGVTELWVRPSWGPPDLR